MNSLENTAVRGTECVDPSFLSFLIQAGPVATDKWRASELVPGARNHAGHSSHDTYHSTFQPPALRVQVARLAAAKAVRAKNQFSEIIADGLVEGGKCFFGDLQTTPRR